MNGITSADWSLVQAFLAVAEEGSLSSAARGLGASQPTVGRQVKSLEQQLGAVLFHRRPKGLELTEVGAELVAPARAMRDAMHQITLSAAGQQTALGGTVRITASVVVSTYHLPRIISQMRIEEPEIEIELVPSDDTRNLLFREADIAIRMYRPTQLDLITKHLGNIPIGMFASEAYLAKHGHPTAETFLQHDFVGYDTDDSIIRGMREAGMDVGRDFFGVRCDDNRVYWELVRAGCGIGFAQVDIGRSDPQLQELDLGFDLPVLPVWLTAHEAMRETPRVRRVWDLLAEGLSSLVS